LITLEFVGFAAISGFTIFLGLPVAIMKNVSARSKGFLNAITIGVLIFILIEILPTAKNITESVVLNSSAVSGVEYVLALLLGLVVGIFALVGYEIRFIRIRRRRKEPENEFLGVVGTAGKKRSVGLGEAEASGIIMDTASLKSKVEASQGVSVHEGKQLALLIAIGIGVHNFTEGLAIGQSYVSAVAGTLAYLLILGFAIHNSTEGFGIAAPMAGYTPSYPYLLSLGLIGGAPTLIGALVGAIWPGNPLLLVFILSTAAGALIYIISGMFYVARRQTSNQLFMFGLFLGFIIAYGTDLWLAMLGA
jgi:zinc transporter, ZIP family